MNQPWITFFSQTGSEIASLIRYLGRSPDCIITNKSDLSDMSRALREEIEKRNLTFIQIPNKPKSSDYKRALKPFKKPLITLHGFLRILPADICKKYEIYNLHPGLIDKYPELKGKDPQKRAIEGNYEVVGCVIHKVVPEVDCGEILHTYPLIIKGYDYNEEKLIVELKNVALLLWREFFEAYDNR